MLKTGSCTVVVQCGFRWIVDSFSSFNCKAPRTKGSVALIRYKLFDGIELRMPLAESHLIDRERDLKMMDSLWEMGRLNSFTGRQLANND